MNDKYGFIYITTNLINGKKYIGQKKIDNNSRWKSYLGSGVHLKNAILKYGKENFKREIIDYADTMEELDELEVYYIDKYNAVDSEEYYNKVRGGFTAHRLKEMNSIPVINIDTSFVFKSIADASRWCGLSESQIIESFDYKHNIKSKLNEFIFKKLEVVKANKKLCKCCAINIDENNPFGFCYDCLEEDEDNLFKFLKYHFSETEECYSLRDNWVKEITSKNKKRTKKEKYAVLKRRFKCKKRKSVMIIA